MNERKEILDWVEQIIVLIESGKAEFDYTAINATHVDSDGEMCLEYQIGVFGVSSDTYNEILLQE